MSIEKLTEIYSKLDFKERLLVKMAVDLGFLSDVSCDWCHSSDDWTKNPTLEVGLDGVRARCPSCGNVSLYGFEVMVDSINLMNELV